jgi:hypothetical protein
MHQVAIVPAGFGSISVNIAIRVFHFEYVESNADEPGHTLYSAACAFAIGVFANLTAAQVKSVLYFGCNISP